MTDTVRANAKVNLHLEVLNKRSDSYHNIFSLNASLDLFDRLTFKRLTISEKCSDIRIDVHADGGVYADIISSIAVEDNLITKAVKLYLSRTGKTGEISVLVEKNIPSGAGLGGGSSDAAAALRLLNAHCSKLNVGLEESELLKLGAELGADVPYCLCGGYAVCRGIGDEIEGIEGKLKYWVLLANCGIMVNTGKAYKALKRENNTPVNEPEIKKKKALFKEGIKQRNINIFKDILKNDFEDPVFSEYPEIRNLKNELADYNPDYAAMTGSGSTVIGLFKDKRRAEIAKDALSKKAKVIIAKFV
ncbi:MAG: 4-(cytidine 5'-diphospho)-2-C-methyl-D-erythritol kinase [Spirochaetota bacterium]